jgi:hypothetical protein
MVSDERSRIRNLILEEDDDELNRYKSPGQSVYFP